MITAQAALEFTSAELAAILTAGFEGYLLPVQFTAPGLERRMRPEHLDPAASKVFFLDARPIGAVMIARRGWNSRVAAMGIAKPFRAQGFGKQMLGQIVDEAKARGDHSLVLEVFEQNPAAVRLYQSVGFEISRRLLGYTKASETGTAANLTEIDPLEFARLVAIEGEANLPWMLSAETFAGYTKPARAFSLNDTAFAMVQEAGNDFILWALLVRRLERRKGWGQQMLQALMHLHAGKNCRVVQIVPEELAPQFFAAVGFERHELNQFEMRLKL